LLSVLLQGVGPIRNTPPTPPSDPQRLTIYQSIYAAMFKTSEQKQQESQQQQQQQQQYKFEPLQIDPAQLQMLIKIVANICQNPTVSNY